MSEDFDVGDLVRLTREFRNEAGVLADPVTVALRVRKPDAATADVTPTKDATGVYHADVTPDQAGVWRYRWATTGNPQTAVEDWFSVRRRMVT